MYCPGENVMSMANKELIFTEPVTRIALQADLMECQGHELESQCALQLDNLDF